MKKNSWTLWMAVFFFATSSLAWAQTTTPKRRRNPAPVVQEVPPENPWYIFIGGDIGYSHYSAYQNSATEAPRGGFDGGFRGLLAHYWEDWVVDGGVGIQWINNQGTNADGGNNTDKTTNAYLDLSPRYRLHTSGNDNFQIGPELEYWLGTDQGLNPTAADQTTISTVNNTSVWLGAQALYEWGEKTKLRLGARGLMALNATGRTVYAMQAFFQVGFDVFHTSTDNDYQKNYERVNEDDLDRVETRQTQPLDMAIPVATPWPNATPEPIPEVMSTPAPPEVEATPFPTPEVAPEPVVINEPKKPAKVILTLDVNDLPFGFNNSNLPKSNAARVRNIGGFLKKNNNSWKALSVGGYTDERGSKSYNLQLSRKRAEAVKKLLVSGGANASKIKTVGYGESHPRDPRHNEAAWAKNRRVELEFKGVKDVVLMKKAMAQ